MKLSREDVVDRVRKLLEENVHERYIDRINWVLEDVKNEDSRWLVLETNHFPELYWLTYGADEWDTPRDVVLDWFWDLNEIPEGIVVIDLQEGLVFVVLELAPVFEAFGLTDFTMEMIE